MQKDETIQDKSVMRIFSIIRSIESPLIAVSSEVLTEPSNLKTLLVDSRVFAARVYHWKQKITQLHVAIKWIGKTSGMCLCKN